jgi:hypothetical protein
VADLAAPADARCEALDAGPLTAGALPADAPAAVAAVDEAEPPETPVPPLSGSDEDGPGSSRELEDRPGSAWGTDDGPESVRAVASDSILDVLADAGRVVLVSAVSGVSPALAVERSLVRDGVLDGERFELCGGTPDADDGEARCEVTPAADDGETSCADAPEAVAASLAAEVTAPRELASGVLSPVAWAWDAASAEAPSAAAACLPWPAAGLSRWLAPEPVCVWPSAGAVRAQCSASALPNGGAPGGADRPGGAPDVGDGVAEDGGGSGAAAKLMRGLP